MKSCENTNTLRPSTVPQPVITPSVYGRSSSPEACARCRASRSTSLNEPSVEQVLDALPGQQLALGVLALDRPRRPGVVRLLASLEQVVELVLHA